MARTALKLVEKVPFQTYTGKLWSSDEHDHHSLHYAITYPDSFRPNLASYFIQKLSKSGDVVLDPFCGRGTAVFEAALGGRIAIGSDISPLAAAITRAKLDPGDLSDIALFLQQLDLKRPVSLDGFRENFSPFFDLDTFIELKNLRGLLGNNSSQVGQFIRLIALSLLHGHTAGYFSVYTFPQISLLPHQQVGLNDKRLQRPDYRAVVPRLLKKAASVLRDGGFGALRRLRREHQIINCDARNLGFLENDSVDLVITAPPRPGCGNLIDDSWLRLWFLGINEVERQRLEAKFDHVASLPSWLEFMNEVLFELARVVRSGGRVALELRETQFEGSSVQLDKMVMDMVLQDLAAYWEPECLFVNQSSSARIGNCIVRSRTASLLENRVLVLRRM